jgi:AraC-like DNA-binding protein
MSKQPERSLFIFSSFKQPGGFYQQLLSGIVSYEGLATRIVRQIEAAHAFRQVERVAELARILVNVPIREYQLIGQYYLVWCKCREIQYQPDVLERLAEQTRTYKAKALISRAALEVFQAQFERALYFYSEAIKANPTISDFIVASRGIATVKSLEGFNASALRHLDELTPLLGYAEPLNYFEVVNSYAVELLANNRLSEAQNVSLIAVSSPFGPSYPEWQETLSEITAKRKRRSTVAISRPGVEQEYEAETLKPVSNVLQFPIEESVPEPRVQTVINFMSANLHRSVSLSELASVVNLSPSHFSHLFKTETGISPGEYLISLRMEKVRHLLATSFLSIKQIMALVSYSNRKDFVRYFKRYFDLTPSEYRKLHRHPVTFNGGN